MAAELERKLLATWGTSGAPIPPSLV